MVDVEGYETRQDKHIMRWKILMQQESAIGLKLAINSGSSRTENDDEKCSESDANVKEAVEQVVPTKTT